ncbi:MAG: DUF1080 domain-containing protein [Solirubrobacterales bacterium]
MNVRQNTRAELYPFVGLVAVAMLVSAAGCASHGNTKRSDWQALFNGQDLSGWTVKCKPADRDKTFWRVEDGCIVADSMGRPDHDYVWLVSDQEYSDFVLVLSFQAYRDNPGNSGVQIRSRYDDQAGWLDGPQVDIHPPGPWRTGMIWDETRGSGRWLYPPVREGQWVNQLMANPDLVFYYEDQDPGWNLMEIRAVGPTISVVLNGISVTSYDGAGILNDPIHQERGVGARGHIALQIHTGDELKVRFKALLLHELTPKSAHGSPR